MDRKRTFYSASVIMPPFYSSVLRNYFWGRNFPGWEISFSRELLLDWFEWFLPELWILVNESSRVVAQLFGIFRTIQFLYFSHVGRRCTAEHFVRRSRISNASSFGYVSTNQHQWWSVPGLESILCKSDFGERPTSSKSTASYSFAVRRILQSDGNRFDHRVRHVVSTRTRWV